MSFDDVVQELVSGPLHMAEEDARALESTLADVKAGLQKVADHIAAEPAHMQADLDSFFEEATHMADKLVAIGGDAIATVAKAIDAATGTAFSGLVQAFNEAASKL